MAEVGRHLRLDRTRGGRGLARAGVGLLCLALVGRALGGPAVATDGAKPVTGLPVPRFVSLKVDRVNLRQGPGTDYPTAWVFHRAGWPVEIVKEFEGWRQIRDSDGTTGWVQGSSLSGRRTVLVTPWEKAGGEKVGGEKVGREKVGGDTARPVEPVQSVLRSGADAKSAPAAYLETGLVANIIGCDGQWCRVSAGAVRGYIEQARLWGVYPGEVVK